MTNKKKVDLEKNISDLKYQGDEASQKFKKKRYRNTNKKIRRCRKRFERTNKSIKNNKKLKHMENINKNQVNLKLYKKIFQQFNQKKNN